MLFASLPLALALAAVPAPTVTHVPLASTYDQATCASTRGPLDEGEGGGWDRAAIGEDGPAPAINNEDCRSSIAAPPLAVDCNDPLVTPWVGEMIGTCDMPRATGPRATLRAARAHDDHRAQRLLAELASATDTTAPLNTTPPEREAPPALLSTLPSMLAPAATGLLAIVAPSVLVSISGDQLLRPPCA